MCIAVFAWQVLHQRPLLLLSNRDEFYQRPAQPLHGWPDEPIWAGRDGLQGGTWLGVTAAGRWAIVTNFREVGQSRDHLRSRGELISAYLTGHQSPLAFARTIQPQQQDYAGFNLIVGDRQQAVYMSNRGAAPQPLASGVYVLCNGLLSDEWEKNRRLRQRFMQEFLPLVHTDGNQIHHQLTLGWSLLEDERKVEPALLPHTGVSAEMEYLLSSPFIRSEAYGTRCSNILQLSTEDLVWWEKTQNGPLAGQVVHQQLTLSPI